MSSYYPGSYDYDTNEEAEVDLTTFHQDSFQQAPLAKIVILEPASFEEIPEVIQALRNQQTIVLNLVQMDFEEAQHSIDFLAGGILMLDGTIEKVDQKIFIFAPYSAEIIYNDQRTYSYDIPEHDPNTMLNQPYFRTNNKSSWHRLATNQAS